nr:MAG TPA: hypothetical protein [Caudoviricetes sp.]
MEGIVLNYSKIPAGGVLHDSILSMPCESEVC